ncbi:hypothetical protein HG15A2_00560 [Adhaeretor mobilis]|uniref:Uncharacterized protein n=2 Tax=Adhaeretor mobilis TaxID=1930276 RepID=A0A517MPI7_9BACT|nr:hypothetical protein HG15A2_00560 [Adhaeretor mobilis]
MTTASPSILDSTLADDLDDCSTEVTPPVEPSYAHPFAGEPLAACVAESSPSGSDSLVGGGMAVFGALTLFWSLLLLLKPEGSHLAGGLVMGAFGGLLLMGGLYVLFHKTFGARWGIAVFAEGIEIIRRNSSQTLLWNEINKVLTLEFFPHRDAGMVLVVRVEPSKGREIKFDTNFGGDPEKVIHYLTTCCDYVVRNPSGYTKRNQ